MRTWGIALAVPLALGSACRTTGTQTQGSRTASTTTMTADNSAAARAAGGVPADTGSRAADDLKAHSDDQVVQGKIGQVSSSSLVITTDDGASRTLAIVPQTTVQVDGRDAQQGDLQEGQPVRASFSDVEGSDVAVEVHAGQAAAGDSGANPTPGSNLAGPRGYDSGGAAREQSPDNARKQH